MSNLRFDKDYLVYDEFGLVEVHCMACDKTIKSRQEIKSQLDPNRIIREVAKHADYKEIPIVFSDGNIAFLMVCDECKFIEIDEMKAERITTQLNRALRLQLEWEGKEPEIVDEMVMRAERKVLRKAEASELGKAKGA